MTIAACAAGIATDGPSFATRAAAVGTDAAEVGMHGRMPERFAWTLAQAALWLTWDVRGSTHDAAHDGREASNLSTGRNA
ncbi:MAG TPA: hypothetical protein VGW57_06880 [Chthoniobacterales bacterium]|nr:hypothetical protein [Chthoniobacterales bacterium]